eukprot:5816333-Pleurochrysis_carterae.AAC.1
MFCQLSFRALPRSLAPLPVRQRLPKQLCHVYTRVKAGLIVCFSGVASQHACTFEERREGCRRLGRDARVASSWTLQTLPLKIEYGGRIYLLVDSCTAPRSSF